MDQRLGKNHARDPESRVYPDFAMSQLHPCPGCLRHVRTSDERCPFCDHSLESALEPHALPERRLGRAALVAFGATLVVSIASTACSSDSDETGRTGTGGTGGSSTGGSGGSTGGSGGSTGGNGGSGGSGGNTGGTAGAATGGAAGSGTGGVAGAGTGGAAGNNFGGFAGNVAPPYGIPPDPDAS
jgi:hypothetical protein